MKLLLQLLPSIFFYLMGSFPSGYILARLNGVDIQKVGSGNVGATNVARTLGRKAGILTLLLDVLKGFLAVELAAFISSGSMSFMALAGLCCVLGHCFSLPPLLSGGKGVATALGVLFALSFTLAITALVVFALCFFSTKIVSASSLAATLAASTAALFIDMGNNAWFSIAGIAAVIFYRHHENISRLIQGNEKKFVSKKAPVDSLAGSEKIQ